MIGTYDNLKLCSYLFVADKFDNSEKIFESFSPIIESLLVNLGNQPYISFMALQEKIDEIYTTRIPKATLKMLLNNLKAEGKIKINNSRIYINGEMLDSQYFNERNKKEQELNELFLGFRQFLLMKNIKITLDEAKQIICKYIFTHCFDLVDFIGHSAKPDQTEEEDLQYISYICEYLCKCKSDGKVLYTAFLRLYKGTVQSTLLNFYPEKIESLQNLNLQIDKVILDSNFIMRILDIQTEIEGQMAQETIYALNSLNVELVVLPQTIEEVSMSIKRFLSESAPYLQSSSEYFGNQHIRMSGLLAAIQRGKTRTNLMELSKPSILKEKLVSAYGICVIHEEDNVPIDLAEEIDSLISSKGIDSYGMKQATHDMLLINYCRQNRKKGIDSFTDARIWVLTNDMKLTYWNQNNSSGIQECITESQLSNLLWIQTPKEDNAGLINTMVALANRELINTTKFYEFINKMQVYKQLNNNPSAIDNISLIFACDCLTMNDISRISDDDHEIDNVIKEKMEIIRKDREENELLLQQSSDENAKLKVELKIYKLMIEKEELLKKIQENRNLQEHLKVEIQELQERRDDTLKISNYKKNAGRVLTGIIIAVTIFFVFVVIKLWSVIKTIIDKVVNELDVLNLPEWIKDEMLPTVITVAIYALIFVLTGVLTGTPMNPKELFNYFREKILKYIIKVKNIRDELLFVDLEKEREKIDDTLKQKKQNNTLLEQLQDYEHELQAVEKELYEWKSLDINSM